MQAGKHTGGVVAAEGENIGWKIIVIRTIHPAVLLGGGRPLPAANEGGGKAPLSAHPQLSFLVHKTRKKRLRPRR